MEKINKHFNRIETENAHWYTNNTGDREIQDHLYEGYFKCKLVHAKSFSVVIPDLILIESPSLLWIQPLFFLANIFLKHGTDIAALIFVDISCSQTLHITFKNHDFIRRYEDGSELYKCQIKGPPKLTEYSTGSFDWGKNKRILLHLFHHTTEEALKSILSTGIFWLSKWNIQGNKILKNIGYVYFTCLPSIEFDEDLRKIAMASDGKIHFIMDNVEVPTVLPETGLGPYKDVILELPVYRESTLNRKSTLMLKIDAGYLASQHILRHVPRDGPVFYEISSPFTHRLPLNPSAEWNFDSKSLVGDYSEVKILDYVVIGSGTSLRGLKAPFDEEDTKEIAKIQRTDLKGNMLEFWFSEANKDHFNQLKTEFLEFEG